MKKEEQVLIVTRVTRVDEKIDRETGRQGEGGVNYSVSPYLLISPSSQIAVTGSSRYNED
jgi:hypothetical protein